MDRIMNTDFPVLSPSNLLLLTWLGVAHKQIPVISLMNKTGCICSRLPTSHISRETYLIQRIHVNRAYRLNEKSINEFNKISQRSKRLKHMLFWELCV